MDALTSMKNKLMPLNLYILENSHIEDELYVYAVELDRLRAETDRILREGFLDTAEEEGLSEREQMYGRARGDLSSEKRRELIKKRFSLGLGDFTVDGIKTALDSFNLQYTIVEYPSLLKVYVNASGDYTDEEERWIEEQAQKTVPSHLEFQLLFDTLSWEELDASDRTFSVMDAENLSWEQLDRRKEIST